MKNNIFYFLLVASLLSFGLLGCSSEPLVKERLANFTVASTRNVEFSKLNDLSKNLKARGVEAMIWWQDKVPERESIQHVIEDATNKAGGDFMVNCVLYYVSQGEKKGFMVQGDVIEMLGDPYEK